ncbi:MULTISPECIES: DUF192 domain-containing protein [Alphaproteobacteria]|uniref:DUF192 domain-containing protein n=2 Tax=Alphaproteobacteria TaxID=28211 RepID=A0A512HHI8_9HYPH|nr:MULTISPECIES: DUF192 domain-containing protein [Alphaproteobacteria]GEO84916.1 hypothetical protein RNA01_18480 [Ciceribacter naphthalenivorans]GLR22850.1 hypothetical protein GCM10007920_26380 [Ciceribacter naphthalenivorans]GLT05706.1 hypothetical protein GCM10007926_26380 [Sphingomonas psychrolutea]
MALFLWTFVWPAAAEAPHFDRAPLTIRTTAGKDVTLDIEWAITPDQREHGLMFREHLDADQGMIFDFGMAREVMMWMKNTPLPLDMLFIAPDGRVMRVVSRTSPYSEAIIASRSPVRYVLEIRGGRAEELGIGAGAMVALTPSKGISD